MRDIVEALVDAGSFFEIGRRWGRPVITGFARLDGWPVAVLASDPYHYGGAWTADAARKIRRHVDLAQTFHLPVVHLVDVPGIMVGLEAEQKGTLRFAAEAIAAIMGSTCRGAPSSCASAMASAAARTRTTRATRRAMRGLRRTGARCP